MAAPHPQSNILPLNDVIPLAQSLARKEAHRPDDVDDLIQEGLFAYHKAEQRHRRQRLPVRKPWSLARTTMQRAIRGYYWQQREWQGRDEFVKAVSLDQEGGPTPPTACTQVERLELDDYFNALERTVGPTARLIVENLLMPSGNCAARILCEARDKQERQGLFHDKYRKARSRQPRGAKQEIRISHRLVRDTLDISPQEWAQNMECIRDFTRNWIGH